MKLILDVSVQDVVIDNETMTISVMYEYSDGIDYSQLHYTYHIEHDKIPQEVSWWLRNRAITIPKSKLS